MAQWIGGSVERWLCGARWGVWVRFASNWNCFKLRKFKLHGQAGETKQAEKYKNQIESNRMQLELNF